MYISEFYGICSDQEHFMLIFIYIRIIFQKWSQNSINILTSPSCLCNITLQFERFWWLHFITRFFCKEFYNCPSMKSQKFLASYKTQKSLKQDLQRDDFFQAVIGKIEQELTAEEHEFLITFIFQNKHRDRPGHTDNYTNATKQASSKNEESPLMHIKEDVFSYQKRNNKRLITLAEALPTSPQQSRSALAMTACKKLRAPKQHFHTVFAQQEQQENRAPSSPIATTRGEQPKGKLFKIYPLKKTKMPKSKSYQALLKDSKVLKTYNNNFLRDVFGQDQHGFPDEFSERYLITAPQIQMNTTTYEGLRMRKQEEQDKYRSINSLKFNRSQCRNRTAFKLYSRKY